MQPMQTRYFRAEREQRQKDIQATCEIRGCIRHPLGYYPLCILHMKEQKQKALQALLKIHEAVATSGKCTWGDFVRALAERSRDHSASSSRIVVPMSILTDALREVTTSSSQLPSQAELDLIAKAYKSKESFSDNVVCVDILPSLKKMQAAKDMFDAYKKDDSLDTVTDDDTHDVRPFFNARNRKAHCRGGAHDAVVFTDFKQLTDIVGDGLVENDSHQAL